MIKDKIFILFWPLIVLAGIPLTACICVEILTQNALTGNARALIGIFAVAIRNMPIYALFVYSALFWLFYCWFHKPSKRTMLWTMLVGWVLCGFPGMYAMFLIAPPGPRG